MPPKAFMSWSSGKDSAFAFHEARRQGLADIVGVLTTINEVHDRVAMHGVRHALLDRQIAALGVPAIKVALPSPCSREIYEARMAEACALLKGQGVAHMIFGDLFLEDIRAYREEKLKAADMSGIFPLWRRETRALADDMISSGLEAHLVCVDPRASSRPSGASRSVRRERRVSHGRHRGPHVFRAHPHVHRRGCGAGRLCLCRRDSRLSAVKPTTRSLRLSHRRHKAYAGLTTSARALAAS
jgi:diphthamide synthase (EF-2-diphthine--ammonia ligase)